ncbi:hypothetical protein V8G54_026954 [Vigna mungo]|uniref:Uncharacterized protein n=1 Tax=Vigna mungo TaxID=3915 RepID=A0AAQ3MZP2_VIGMU
MSVSYVTYLYSANTWRYSIGSHKAPVTFIKEKTAISRTRTRYLTAQYIVTCQITWPPPHFQLSLLPKIPFSKRSKLPQYPHEHRRITPPRRVSFLRKIIIAHQII